MLRLKTALALALLTLPGCASHHDSLSCQTTPEYGTRCYDPPDYDPPEEPKPPPGHQQQQLAPH